MNNVGRVVGVVLGLTLGGALMFGGYAAIEFIVALFASLDAQTARVTAIASAVVLLAAAIIASAIRAASRTGKAMQIRDQKWATYQLFVDYWDGVLATGRAPAVRGSDDATEKSRTLDRLLALYGGAAVIKAHDALRAARDEKGARHADVAAQFGKALLEIRKDLGSGTQGIGGPELLRLVAPDADPTIAHARADQRLA